jgi:hypothetical protein
MRYHYKMARLSWKLNMFHIALQTSTQGPMFTDKKKYFYSNLSKIMLIIYLISSSGKIPAGNATVDLNSLKKGLNKIETNILKCPDKSASISFSISLEVEN